jgi:hypothetical protein
LDGSGRHSYNLLGSIKDTQCGFKTFQHDAARKIFSRMKTKRFGFDIELLSIARLLNVLVTEVLASRYNSSLNRPD